MLPRVSVHRFCCAPFTNVANYRRIVGDDLIGTGFDGGVAELLSRHVPLARALGLETDWRVLQGTPEFFTVTKALHNALQGAAHSLTDADKAIYLEVNGESAGQRRRAFCCPTCSATTRSSSPWRSSGCRA